LRSSKNRQETHSEFSKPEFLLVLKAKGVGQDAKTSGITVSKKKVNECKHQCNIRSWCAGLMYIEGPDQGHTLDGQHGTCFLYDSPQIYRPTNKDDEIKMEGSNTK
jgi:hypothetical protein